MTGTIVYPAWVDSWWAQRSPTYWQQVRMQILRDEKGLVREVEQLAFVSIRNQAHVAAKLRAAVRYEVEVLKSVPVPV